jgi:hypothetical protein
MSVDMDMAMAMVMGMRVGMWMWVRMRMRMGGVMMRCRCHGGAVLVVGELRGWEGGVHARDRRGGRRVGVNVNVERRRQCSQWRMHHGRSEGERYRRSERGGVPIKITGQASGLVLVLVLLLVLATVAAVGVVVVVVASTVSLVRRGPSRGRRGCRSLTSRRRC